MIEFHWLVVVCANPSKPFQRWNETALFLFCKGKGEHMNASSRLTALTRIGFATRGLLYIVIALLILWTGRAEDPSGAIEYLGRGGGQFLLGVIAASIYQIGTTSALRAEGAAMTVST